MPTKSHTSSMPLSPKLAWSAFSEEKQTAVPSNAEPLAEQRPELVLGGDHDHRGAGLLEFLEHGCRPAAIADRSS